MTIDIAGRRVGPGEPCFIIAEAGVNHDGSLETARRLVDAAAAAGADAVKFQTFKADRLVTASAPKAAYQTASTPAGEGQHAMLRRLELSADAHRALAAACRERRIAFLSTPFDEDSADLLAELGVPAFKIGSGELTNLPFLVHVAKKGRPLIVSTGMATLSEVEAALHAVAEARNRQVVLLHCVSNYPADPADVNLRAMATMTRAFGVPVGYSDHTTGLEIAIAAVALGACVIEKHFTHDRTAPGPDHRASLEPAELAALVRGIRATEASLGHGRKEPAPSEAATALVARRSLVVAKAVRAGTVLTEDLIAIKRPGTGLPPAMRHWVIGRRAAEDLAADTVLTLDMLS
jgi:N,N'-diacetyllegionaminate synthase